MFAPCAENLKKMSDVLSSMSGMDADFISRTSNPSTCNNKNFTDKVAQLKALGAPYLKALGEDSAIAARLKLRASAGAGMELQVHSMSMKTDFIQTLSMKWLRGLADIMVDS